MGARNHSLSEVGIWHLGSSHLSGNFEKRTRNMVTVPSWVNTRGMGDQNSLENLQVKGFSFPETGMTFSTGNVSIDLNQGTAHRFVLCQVGVGRAFVVDDPTEQPTIPDGYDSLYLALSTDADTHTSYRHEYSISDSNQVLPMYLVQFFVDSGSNVESGFGAGRNEAENIYDRYDFFDPVLYAPVSVRDKMMGSHSTGEYAQHKLIGISDAFESALSESVKPDEGLIGRQNEIQDQLRAIDVKLRQVSDNSAKVEEDIYKALQEALFQLQDSTQEKMSALLSEEVELRRQLQQAEWVEAFLDHQRDNASQLEFLNGWKCHVQLRADLVRIPLATSRILDSVSSTLELRGEVYVEEEGMNIPLEDEPRNMLPTFQETVSTNEITRVPGGIRTLPEEYHNTIPQPPVEKPKPIVEDQKMDEEVKTTDIRQEPTMLPDAARRLTTISSTTPARFASFSLKAEATRRLKQQGIDSSTSLEIAKSAFKESKLLERADFSKIEREITEQRNEDEDRHSFLVKESQIYSNAQSLLYCVPWPNRTVPATRLLYATWQPGVERSVTKILASMPVYVESSHNDDNSEDEEPERKLSPISTLLVIKSNGRVFGGYADEPWRDDGNSFGRAKCFLFSSTMDIKIPFHGKKTLEPPLKPDDEEEFDDYSSPKFCVLKSSPSQMQFGVRDLVLRDKLTACSSDLEYSFGVGLRAGSEEAGTLLAGSSAFVVDELELWALEQDKPVN